MLGKNVLLLEAGPSLSIIPELPIFGPMWQDSMYDWNYETEPQRGACRAMDGSRSRWPRGKIFGGSHMLSNLIQMVGEPAEYRQYVDPEQPFDYDSDIGQYFREYETLMDIQEVPFRTEFSRLLKSAGSEIKFHGFHHPNVSVRNGFRHTTATLYRQHARAGHGRDSNHTLLFNVMVNKLLLCPDSSHVDGVEFTKGGEVYVAKARKAVILSAGAIGSPAILLRSGIGPKEDLEAVGVEHRVELPVGKHLMDHVATGLDLVSLNSSFGTGLFDILSMDNLFKFWLQDEGLIAMPGCDLVGALKVLPNESVYNDLQFMIIPFAINSDSGVHLRRILNIRDDVYYHYFHPEENGRQSVTILASVLKPKSEGTVRLRSSDPSDPPLIDPQYLTHSYDKRVLYEGIQLIQRLVDTEAMQKLGAKIKQQPFPGCEHLPFDSQLYWMCYIEHVTLTSYHPAGTCRMGSCPRDSVVDYHFRVHGVENLYVVDASVMPQLPAANPIATINMLALRFADREIQ